jgi:hypothetical protein
MRPFLRKYGTIGFSILLIFLSGQGIGWMLATHNCQGTPPPTVDADKWTEEMLSRLVEDLDLGPDQAVGVRRQLSNTASQMQHERDRAMFQIHLQILRLHDDLESSVTPGQKPRLQQSRQEVIESIRRKFPQFLSDPALGPELKSATDPPAQ